MSCTTAPQVVCFSRLATKRAAFDLTGELRDGVTLSSATLAVSPSGPTLGSATVNVAAITIGGVEAAIGKAITFLVTGGAGVSAGTYTITVTAATSDSESLVVYLTLVLE